MKIGTSVVDGTDSDAMLDVQAVARMLGVHDHTVRMLVTARKIQFKRIGKKLLRFRRAWVDDYVEGRTR